MKKLMLVLVLLVGMLISAGGCATIMNGPNDMVNIYSAPPGAEFTIRIDGGSVVATGITPQNVLLARKTHILGSSYSVQFKKDGYQNKTMSIKSTMSFWYIGNIVFGGIPGMIIDCVTGAADDLHNVSVRLVPITLRKNQGAHYLERPASKIHKIKLNLITKQDFDEHNLSPQMKQFVEKYITFAK